MLVGNNRFGARVQADSSRLMTSRANVPDDGSDQRSGEFIAPNPAKKRSSCVPLPCLENFPASLRRGFKGWCCSLPLGETRRPANGVFAGRPETPCTRSNPDAE